MKTDVLYEEWAGKDPNFAEKLLQIGPGLRTLNLCPIETTISTICTANNNAPRITKMLKALCENFGTLAYNRGKAELYTFPTLEALITEGVEEKLRSLGFGYRAKYVVSAATGLLRHGGIEWLNELKNADYHTAWRLIMTLPGVGPKVADCILLFSLKHDEAFPIDTHILKVAKRNYDFTFGKHLTLTPRVYLDISNRFRELFGPMAGWAQSVLFATELNSRYHTSHSSDLPIYSLKSKKLKNSIPRSATGQCYSR